MKKILFALQTHPDLSASIFGLTEFSFNEMLVMKNMMKQQESSPLQLQENHLKRIIFCMVITFVFTMQVRFVKTSHFSYIYKLILSVG